LRDSVGYCASIYVLVWVIGDVFGGYWGCVWWLAAATMVGVFEWSRGLNYLSHVQNQESWE
jgi:hypothetical protein